MSTKNKLNNDDSDRKGYKMRYPIDPEEVLDRVKRVSGIYSETQLNRLVYKAKKACNNIKDPKKRTIHWAQLYDFAQDKNIWFEWLLTETGPMEKRPGDIRDGAGAQAELSDAYIMIGRLEERVSQMQRTIVEMRRDLGKDQ